MNDRIVNQVRRAIMSEIDRRSAAVDRLLPPHLAKEYRAPLGDLVGWLAGADVAELLRPAVRQCSKCGCTEGRACSGGCSWIGPELCSACTPGRARK